MFLSYYSCLFLPHTGRLCRQTHANSFSFTLLGQVTYTFECCFEILIARVKLEEDYISTYYQMGEVHTD